MNEEGFSAMQLVEEVKKVDLQAHFDYCMCMIIANCLISQGLRSCVATK
jgi:hypothetical protein